MDNNKVGVKIYGQEYVIAGEESREHIIKVADFVDSKMRAAEKAVKTGQISVLAVLSAVNIASDFFSAREQAVETKKLNEQLERDVTHYVQMWEEAKRNFLQYKEDAQVVSRKKENLKNALDEKEQELSKLRARLEKAEGGAQNAASEELEKLQEKLKEIENSYFDLQMENVQLKSELERMKKSV